jgi:hypothetical protein
MARKDIVGLFRVNRSVTNLGAESRPMQLPTMNPFPRLDQRITRTAPICTRDGVAIIGGLAGALPEMTTDVLDVAAGYAVENVKRDRIESRSALRFGWGQLVGRVLGNSHRAARP